MNYEQLPGDLPKPIDDGSCDHLVGKAMPPVRLPSTHGNTVALDALPDRWTVLYCYPMTGVPGQPLPAEWDLIPGARGCTPQTCAFRDHYADLAQHGAAVYGVSTQSTDYQREMTGRLHVPFAILSDADFGLCAALQLPTFEVDGMRLIKRLTLIVANGSIAKVFYPVFPPDQNASEVLRWLGEHPSSQHEA